MDRVGGRGGISGIDRMWSFVHGDGTSIIGPDGGS